MGHDPRHTARRGSRKSPLGQAHMVLEKTEMAGKEHVIEEVNCIIGEAKRNEGHIYQTVTINYIFTYEYIRFFFSYYKSK